MAASAHDIDAITSRRIELEMNMVRDAIVAVASGASRRITVGGLRFGEQLLAAATDLATQKGVTVHALWSDGSDGGADILVEAHE